MAKFLPLTCYFLLVNVIASTLAAPQPFKALFAPTIQPNYSSPILTMYLNRNGAYLIDIESPFSWGHCPKGAFPHVSCATSQCSAAQSNYKPPFCNLPTPKCPSKNYTNCLALPWNPIAKTCGSAQLTYYTRFLISSTNGYNPGPDNVVYDKVYMSCAPKALIRGLPWATRGVVGLSRGPLSLASQLSNSDIPNKFSLCFGGMAFFGEGPFYLTYGPAGVINLSKMLNYVPLLNHPIDPLGYYIGLNSISVNGQVIKFTEKAANDQVVKLSTVTPYTIVRSYIYRALVDQFAEATKGPPYQRVPKVAPFELCFNSSTLPYTRSRVGPATPNIDLGLTSGWKWTMIGYNSIVKMPGHVACLAFVDGGDMAEQAMVIGMHQMMQNFVEFDLVNSRLGLTGSLLSVPTNCNNFNFTYVGIN